MKVCLTSQRLCQKKGKNLSLGFTLLELLVVISTIGILFAIAAPTGMGLLHTARLNTAQSEVYQAIREAQHKAKLHRTAWQFSIRESQDSVQWAVHPDNTLPPNSTWKKLDSHIRIDEETTLLKTNGIHQMLFNHLGTTSGQLGRLTLSIKANVNSSAKRCVIVSTILGAIRKGSEHSKPRDGKYCY